MDQIIKFGKVASVLSPSFSITSVFVKKSKGEGGRGFMEFKEGSCLQMIVDSTYAEFFRL